MAGAPTTGQASHTPNPFEGVFGGSHNLTGAMKPLSAVGTKEKEPDHTAETDDDKDDAPEKILPRASRLAQHMYYSDFD